MVALLHIGREQAPVLHAELRRLVLTVRQRVMTSLNWVRSRKLTLALYGLLFSIGLEAFSLFGGLFTGLSLPLWLGASVDVVLLVSALVFLFLLKGFISALLAMERQDDGDIVQFSGEVGDLLSLRCAIDSAPEAIALWDKQGELRLANRKFKETFAGHGDQLRDGALAYEQFGSCVHKLMMRPHVRSKRGTEKFTAISYETQLRDGRWLHLQEQPTVDGGVFCVSFDMTDLKTVQQNLTIREEQMRSTVQDLRVSRRELEQKTQKLAELAEKLMHEKNRAEDANRVKSAFLANISHELRTPLNAIIGFSDIMHRETFGPLENDNYKSYITDIHASGAYLLELINDILDMSKIEAGRLKLDTHDCALAPLLQDCVKLVAPQAREKDIALRPQFDKDIVCAVDGRAIKQVMLNLLSNAIKFTDNHGQVEIFAEQHQQDVTITVKDTGIGIDPSYIDLLGRPFVQVENQLTKSYPGTGLGLAISRRLVGLHGGDLTIESEINVGTTVRVTLPLSPPALDEGKSPSCSLAA